jgi:peptidyl-prolyl cis-trans isomerase B (cyclophilin B)
MFKNKAMVFPGVKFFIAAASTSLFLLTAAATCGPDFTRNDPILEKPVDELTDDEISRMAAVVETNYGSFKIALHPEWAPVACRKFIGLVRSSFYYMLTFHEVRPGYWIVGGDPLGDGTGGPGFNLEIESPSGPNVKGAVGLYHPWLRPDLSGSQFYIMLKNRRGMDGKYTVFGQVIEGMSTAERIGKLPVTPAGGKPRPFMPLTEVMIKDMYLEIRKK